MEDYVTERTITIVPWNWINQFPLYHQSGKTKISKWDHELIYPKKSLFPKIREECKVFKGKVLLTEGVDLEDFKILG